MKLHDMTGGFGLIGFCSSFLDVMKTSCFEGTRGALR
jgi:hypothetical protein